MDIEFIISENKIVRPFESRVISEQLRAKVKYFQKLLAQKRNRKSYEKHIQEN